MKKLRCQLVVFSALVLFQSCAAPKYFHDDLSYQRQVELQECRSKNIFCDVAVGVGSIIFSVATETDVGYIPSGQQFKKLKLINMSSDTMYINMLTDLVWDEKDYCDFMDIRIPPHLKCKVLVPINAMYNVYFSTTPQSNDDEMLEVFTGSINRLALTPGLTLPNDDLE